jgi:trimeric autotransporter adhesin
MRNFDRKWSLIASVSAVLLLVLAVGCRGFFVNPTLSSLAIGPQSATITASPVQTLQMSATGTYSDGSTKDLTGKVLWNSATPGCATISNSGLVTPVSTVAGICTTQISASFGTVSPATTTITVAEGVPSKIQLNVSTTTPTANTTVTFTALATFNGVQQDITTSVTWTNSDTTDLTLTNGSGLGTLAVSASGKTINVTANFNGVASNTVTLNVQ